MVSMIFNGVDLFDKYALLVNQKTTFLPPLRRRQIEVNGKDGVVNLGGETFGQRTLIAECFFYRPLGASALQRELALLLSKRGRIAFSDEPELEYVGRVYDGANMERMDFKGRKFDLSFECQPFLYGPVRTISGADTVEINYKGTARTPTRIVIKNTGSEDIVGLVLTQKIIER